MWIKLLNGVAMQGRAWEVNDESWCCLRLRLQNRQLSIYNLTIFQENEARVTRQIQWTGHAAEIIIAILNYTVITHFKQTINK